jgi:adenylate cyclase class 2
MATEIEKKYRLTTKRTVELRSRLRELAGEPSRGVEFEENVIYTGAGLGAGLRTLRLRRVGTRALLTLKEREPSPDAIKRQREEETEVADANVMDAILRALGYAHALVYEKRRETWHLEGVEVVVDELSFGLFAEIEGEADAIRAAELKLNLADAEAEHATYPALARTHGKGNGDVIEARFDAGDSAST